MLFVPGNAGSYKQVRSVATESAAEVFNYTRRMESCLALRKLDPEGLVDCSNFQPRQLDFFALDFGEEFAAFRGQTILDQAEYLNDALAFIRGLYKDKHLARREGATVVAHSMGGIVTRAAMTLPNYVPKSIGLVVTLATPHDRAPLVLDRTMEKVYRDIHELWKTNVDGRGLVSIAGGNRDFMFGSELCSTASFLPPSDGFTIFATGIPGVLLTTDHLAILWCNQLIRLLARTLVLSQLELRSGKPINEIVKLWSQSLRSPAKAGSKEDHFKADSISGFRSTRISLPKGTTTYRHSLNVGSIPYLHYDLYLTQQGCRASRTTSSPLLFQSVTCGVEEKVFQLDPTGRESIPVSFHCDGARSSPKDINVQLRLTLDDNCESNSLRLDLNLAASMSRLIRAKFFTTVPMAVGAGLHLVVVAKAAGQSLISRTRYRVNWSATVATGLLAGQLVAGALLPRSIYKLAFGWTSFYDQPLLRSAIEALVLVPLATTLGSLSDVVIRILATVFGSIARCRPAASTGVARIIMVTIIGVTTTFGAPFGVSLGVSLICFLATSPSNTNSTSMLSVIVLLLIPNGLRAAAAMSRWLHGGLHPADRQLFQIVAITAYLYITHDLRPNVGLPDRATALLNFVAVVAFATGEGAVYLVTDTAAVFFGILTIATTMYSDKVEGDHGLPRHAD